MFHYVFTVALIGGIYQNKETNHIIFQVRDTEAEEGDKYEFRRQRWREEFWREKKE